jgi:hypothetical protein
VLTVLLLSRALRPGRLHALLAAYLALLLGYGLGNVVNDGWLEQVAERGWTSWTIPSSIEPHLNWTWLAVVLAAPLIWWFWFRPPPRRADAVDAPPVPLS